MAQSVQCVQLPPASTKFFIPFHPQEELWFGQKSEENKPKLYSKRLLTSERASNRARSVSRVSGRGLFSPKAVSTI